MLIAMAEDIRVIIIKLADRLHNMRTGRFWKPQKQRDKALENMEVYAPSHRLGIRAVKEENSRTFLCVTWTPLPIKEIESGLALHRNEREAFIEETKSHIRGRVALS